MLAADGEGTHLLMIWFESCTGTAGTQLTGSGC